MVRCAGDRHFMKFARVRNLTNMKRGTHPLGDMLFKAYVKAGLLVMGSKARFDRVTIHVAPGPKPKKAARI
jgi:hypothetical protein